MERTLFVFGRVGLPGGASNAMVFWIVRQRETTFETLTKFAGEVEILTNRTNGYEDLEILSRAFPHNRRMYISLK